MAIQIIKRKNGVYDVYDKESGRWIFSRVHPDNVLLEMSNIENKSVYFVDEEYTDQDIIEEKINQDRCVYNPNFPCKLCGSCSDS